MNFVTLHQRWVHPLCKRWARFTDYSLGRVVLDGWFFAPRWAQHGLKTFIVWQAVRLGVLLTHAPGVCALLAALLVLALHVGYVARGVYPPDPLDWVHELACVGLAVCWWVPWCGVAGAVAYVLFYPYATP